MAVLSEEVSQLTDCHLDVLGADIKAHPRHLEAFDSGLHDRMRSLVGDVEVDLDAALSADDE